MSRINVYQDGDYGERERVGHFDGAKARRWSDADYNGDGSRGTGRGEAIIRTAQGRWVHEVWTRWQGEESTYDFVDDERAREWLLSNQYDDAVQELFGEVEEEVGPGRPEVGPATTVRLGDKLTAQLDDLGRATGESRAALIRRLLEEKLAGY